MNDLSNYDKFIGKIILIVKKELSTVKLHRDKLIYYTVSDDDLILKEITEQSNIDNYVILLTIKRSSGNFLIRRSGLVPVKDRKTLNIYINEEDSITEFKLI